MRRRRNPCVYTGLVGRKMPLRTRKPSRRIIRNKVNLSGGPLDGTAVMLDATAGFTTFTLAPMRGFGPGRYVGGQWETT